MATRRKGWGRYSQRSRGLLSGTGDPRQRRDAQAASLDALRGNPPLEVNRLGETALATEQDLVTRSGRLGLDHARVVAALPKGKTLQILNGALDVNPAKQVSDLASGSTLAQTVAKVNALLVSLRKGGLVKKQG